MQGINITNSLKERGLHSQLVATIEDNLHQEVD